MTTKTTNTEGRTIVVVTHDLRLAGRAKRALRLVNGAIQPKRARAARKSKPGIALTGSLSDTAPRRDKTHE